jgi:hypothetical protein
VLRRRLLQRRREARRCTGVMKAAGGRCLGGGLGSWERMAARERVAGPMAAALPVFPDLFGAVRRSWVPFCSTGMVPGRRAPTSTAPPCGELLLRPAKPVTAMVLARIRRDAEKMVVAGTSRGFFVFSFFFGGLSGNVPRRVSFPVYSGGFRVMCTCVVLS